MRGFFPQSGRPGPGRLIAPLTRCRPPAPPPVPENRWSPRALHSGPRGTTRELVQPDRPDLCASADGRRITSGRAGGYVRAGADQRPIAERDWVLARFGAGTPSMRWRSMVISTPAMRRRIPVLASSVAAARHPAPADTHMRQAIKCAKTGAGARPASVIGATHLRRSRRRLPSITGSNPPWMRVVLSTILAAPWSACFTAHDAQARQSTTSSGTGGWAGSTSMPLSSFTRSRNQVPNSDGSRATCARACGVSELGHWP
jgi:hypothetical protein